MTSRLLPPGAAYLDRLAAVPDVRRIEKRGWRHHVEAPAWAQGGA